VLQHSLHGAPQPDI
nr:immunoglobulin heavy chain junction region [Mus musculus]